jgi:RimJ/RimL family protein N-acetyltransferase
MKTNRKVTLNLVPFAPEHFTVLAAWFGSERDVVQWGGPAVSFPLDSNQMQRMLEEGRSDPPARLCWMAADSERFVGHAQLAFDWRNGVARVSRVAVAPEARGRDFAVPMLRLVLDRAFSRLEVERAELNVHALNIPAIRVYQRLGFVHEGTRRSCRKVGSERWDIAVMGLLRTEWQLLS